MFGTHHLQPAIVTPWMTNGTLLTYLKENPHADRIPLVRFHFFLNYHVSAVCNLFFLLASF
jgi:hypothetical protein